MLGSVAKLLTVKLGWEGFISDSLHPSVLKTSSENPGHLQISGILEFQGLIVL